MPQSTNDALAQNSLRWANFEDQCDKDWVRDVDRAGNALGAKGKDIRNWNQQWKELSQ